MVLGDVIRRNARRFPNDLALVFKENRFNFEQYHQRTNILANALIDLGAQKGDRICIIMDNCHQHLEFTGAAWKAGLVAVPLSTHLKQELDHIIDNAKPSVVIVGDNYLKKVNPEWASVKNVVCIGRRDAGVHNYEDLMDKYFWDDPNVEVKEEDMSMIYYTSGTTGLPKGVCYTHIRQIRHAEDQVLATGSFYHQDRRALAVHPLYFNAPMNCTTIPAMIMANPVVILESFSPKAFLVAVEKEKISSVSVVPTMIFRLLEYPDLPKYDISSLRRLSYGSAPMPVNVLRKAIKVFGNVLSQGYGLTECTGACAFLSVEEHVTEGPERLTRRLASCGRERPNCWMKVVRKDGSEIARDLCEIGEIVLKCEYLMTGYFHMPEETAKVIKDGWLYTGDMASMDEDGYIYIRDRKSDMIISGGVNIYPWEVEEVLFTHPAVLEAAVIGKPNEEWGEIVKAYIVLKPGRKATAEEIIDHTKEKLATYKKPKEIEFVDSLPHNPTGKVMRRELKKIEMLKRS